MHGKCPVCNFLLPNFSIKFWFSSYVAPMQLLLCYYSLISNNLGTAWDSPPSATAVFDAPNRDNDYRIYECLQKGTESQVLAPSSDLLGYLLNQINSTSKYHSKQEKTKTILYMVVPLLHF